MFHFNIIDRALIFVLVSLQHEHRLRPRNGKESWFCFRLLRGKLFLFFFVFFNDFEYNRSGSMVDFHFFFAILAAFG